MAVDEAGRGQAAAAVDAPVRRRRLGRGPRADRDDPVALDDDVPVAVLRAGRVDGGDRAALDDDALAHARLVRAGAASRTASRIFS